MVEIDNWAELSEALWSVWQDTAYLTLRERRSVAGTDTFEEFARLTPHGDSPCPLLERAAQRLHGNPSDPDASAMEGMDDAVCFEVALSAIEDEIRQWANGTQHKLRVVVAAYRPKGGALLSRTVLAKPPNPTPGRPEEAAVALASATGAQGTVFAALDEIADPTMRLVLTALMLQSTGFKEIQSGYRSLFDEVKRAWGEVHQAATSTIKQVEVSARARHHHIERLELGRLREISNQVQARRRELEATTRSGDADDAVTTAADVEVKREAVTRAMDLGDKLLGAVTQAIGVDAVSDFGPLMDELRAHPELARLLKDPAVARSLKNPEVRDIVRSTLETLREVPTDGPPAS